MKLILDDVENVRMYKENLTGLAIDYVIAYYLLKMRFYIAPLHTHVFTWPQDSWIAGNYKPAKNIIALNHSSVLPALYNDSRIFKPDRELIRDERIPKRVSIPKLILDFNQ